MGTIPVIYQPSNIYGRYVDVSRVHDGVDKSKEADERTKRHDDDPRGSRKGLESPFQGNSQRSEFNSQELHRHIPVAKSY